MVKFYGDEFHHKTFDLCILQDVLSHEALVWTVMQVFDHMWNKLGLISDKNWTNTQNIISSCKQTLFK